MAKGDKRFNQGGKVLVLPRELLRSRAWRELKRKRADTVYLEFLYRRQMESFKHPRRGKQWRIANNGQITFTYTEAQELYGIAPKVFTAILDELIAHGFIEITQSGNYGDSSANYFFISEKWRDFGKPGFTVQPRPKDTRLIELGENLHKNQRKPIQRIRASNIIDLQPAIQSLGKVQQPEPGATKPIKRIRAR